MSHIFDNYLILKILEEKIDSKKGKNKSKSSAKNAGKGKENKGPGKGKNESKNKRCSSSGSNKGNLKIINFVSLYIELDINILIHSSYYFI